MTSPTSTVSSNPNPNPDDLVLILAALLCAVICVLGLFAVARCAWIRRLSSSSSTPIATFSSPHGLKKKVLESLPKLTISADEARSDDCAICLSEFVVGEEVRVLPECGHGFHVVCIDRWLVSHSSCPSCRRVLGTGDSRCRNCGGGGAAAMAAATFLP